MNVMDFVVQSYHKNTAQDKHDFNNRIIIITIYLSPFLFPLFMVIFNLNDIVNL